MKTFFTYTFVLSVFVLMACSDKRKSESTEQQSDNYAIPALFERQGELAKAAEWPKTREKVDELMARIKKDPSDLKARLQVATIYLSEARITGEHPYYYPAVLKILDGVLAMDPQNFEATTFKSSVKMSQHKFAEARVLAEKAKSLNPDNAYVYGVLVDANVELGDYEQAVAMSDKMQALKPSLESYSRASYLREIYGNYPGSIAAMQLAVDAGLPGSEPQCWSKYTLAHLYETVGDLKKAEQQYDEILAMRPSYAFAMRGKAHIYKERKQYEKAISELEKASEVMPEFSFQEDMADIFALQGNTAKAAEKYAETVKMLNEDAVSGHAVDLELCKLYTKTGQLDSALVYGNKELASRPENIDVNHALAAVYLKQKNSVKAKEHLKIALHTGSKDPELLMLASEVENNMGNKKEGAKYLAMAKKTNPAAIL